MQSLVQIVSDAKSNSLDRGVRRSDSPLATWSKEVKMTDYVKITLQSMNISCMCLDHRLFSPPINVLPSTISTPHHLSQSHKHSSLTWPRFHVSCVFMQGLSVLDMATGSSCCLYLIQQHLKTSLQDLTCISTPSSFCPLSLSMFLFLFLFHLWPLVLCWLGSDWKPSVKLGFSRPRPSKTEA